MTDRDDPRRFSPAAARNTTPILELLRALLPDGARVLEVAAGTGQHAAAFATARPDLSWQPTDADPANLASIEAWRRSAEAPGLKAPRALDVHDDDWAIGEVDAVFCANMVHIAPWSACEALMRGAARALVPDGLLLLYGPFAIDGAHTAPSNAAFDRSLKARDPRWGVRDLADVTAAAGAAGLAYERRWPMPANNFVVAFRKPRP